MPASAPQIGTVRCSLPNSAITSPAGVGHLQESTYVDTGWSVAKASRPELNRLMADARARKFDVLCWKLDRRGRGVLDCYESIQQLRSLGVRWIATSQGLDRDENNPMSPAMLGLMAIFAELERELIRERTRPAGCANSRTTRRGRWGRPYTADLGKIWQSEDRNGSLIGSG
jgi:DNA invertase Pin-like site-specific DNA recombinase